AAAAAVTVIGVGSAGTAYAAPAGPASELVGQSCPVLFALGMQGTGESSPDTSPTLDTGMLSQVFMPMMVKTTDSAGDSLTGRAYVPYPAGFGGAVPGANVPYSQSVEEGLHNLEDTAAEVAQACPDTVFTGAGYSQGAHAMSMFAKKVGAGEGPIPAEKLVGVALFGDPTRSPGAPLFPGAAGQTSPKPAPGTAGTEVAKVSAPAGSAPEGGGIGPTADHAVAYGSLTGRVASLCEPGDLSCDAPANAPIMRAVANIAGQSELSTGDPIQSLTSVSEALALTTIKTVVPVINEDIKGTTLANLSIEPRKSLSERVAIASDPRTEMPTAQESIAAVMKVGTIGFNAVKTVVKEVLTPANIAQLATVGLANPAAGVALFAAKLVGAVPKLVPPATTSRLTKQAFDVVKDNISDNAELVSTTALTKYWDTVRAHGSYGSTPVTATGQSAAQFVADWFAALAKDVAGGTDSTSAATPRVSPSTSAIPRTSSPRPAPSSSRTSTTSPRPTSTTPTAAG
ncbi:MAG: cutinase family protein, partial [Rhodococcus sp. (in: high G+C Gram-positive bacteria)]|uniref:cutinase family protein n=1 Tax=Rhodococcus sp. TaxID=1831 RepID=UPI003BB2037A